MYQPQLYAIIVGAVLPIPFWLLQRRRPNSWAKYISTYDLSLAFYRMLLTASVVHRPVVLNGVSYIPPSVGINFSSWFLVGFIFQYIIRKRNFAWWSKFNYVTSAAVDIGAYSPSPGSLWMEGSWDGEGTVAAVIVIFFTLQFPKGGFSVNWWGNRIFQESMSISWAIFSACTVAHAT